MPTFGVGPSSSSQFSGAQANEATAQGYASQAGQAARQSQVQADDTAQRIAATQGKLGAIAEGAQSQADTAAGNINAEAGQVNFEEQQMVPLSAQAAAGAEASAEQQRQIAGEQRGVGENLIAQSQDPNAVEAARTRSMADVASSFEGAKAAQQRSNVAMGINPGDPAAQAGSNAASVNKAAAEVGAGNTAALAERQYRVGLGTTGAQVLGGAASTSASGAGTGMTAPSAYNPTLAAGVEESGMYQGAGALELQGKGVGAQSYGASGSEALAAPGIYQPAIAGYTGAESGLTALAGANLQTGVQQQQLQQNQSGLLGFLKKGGRIPGRRGLGVRPADAEVQDPPRFGVLRNRPLMRAPDGQLRPTSAGPAEGHITGPGRETDDRIPAMLSHGEYVHPAFVGSNLGVHTLDGIVEIARRADAGDPKARQTAAKIMHTVAGFGVQPPQRVAGKAPVPTTQPFASRRPGFGVRADFGGLTPDDGSGVGYGDESAALMPGGGLPSANAGPPGMPWTRAAMLAPPIQVGAGRPPMGQQLRSMAHNPMAIAKGVAMLAGRGGGVRALGASLGG
ncbi:MAG: hypothetical protein KGL39_06975 [Patescibacteria group bacterium]|nr:hypothetical protein [Patescibacteria group bacterium]